MGNYLRTLRERRGWTHQQAADAMNISRGQYIKLERGERRPKSVPIVGRVGAGSEAHYYDVAQGPFDDVEAPSYASADTVAVQIVGDSLGSFFNSWLVFYDEVHTPPTEDMLRKTCVVGLTNGQVLIKKLLPGSRRGVFHLVSQTEGIIEDAEVEWAAVVLGMQQR
jgi:hypothetical protein